MSALKQIAMALAIAAAIPTLAQAVPQYTVTLIGPQYGSASAINNAGVVVGGYYNLNTNMSSGFVWSKGALGGFGGVGKTGQYATGVNEHGAISLVAGELDIVRGHSYRLDNGVYTYVPDFKPGATTRALGLNNNGVVVGDSGLGQDTYDTDALRHGFIYQAGHLTDVGTLGGAQSSAAGINDAGVAAGWADLANGEKHAYVYDQGVMTDLGTLGGHYSAAYSINNLGAVVGSATNAGGSQAAVLWDHGVTKALGWAGYASDINEHGQIVGYGNNGSYLYSNGVAYNLNTLIDPASGLTIQSARGINDLGQIVGSACNSMGDCTAMLLTPVPEPETYGMLLGGLAVIGYAARRRKAVAA